MPARYMVGVGTWEQMHLGTFVKARRKRLSSYSAIGDTYMRVSAGIKALELPEG